MPQWSKAPGVVRETVDGCAVLIDPTGAELVRLNAVGTAVWESLDADEAALVSAVRGRWPDVSQAQAQDDVSAFLATLVGHGLVCESAQLGSDA